MHTSSIPTLARSLILSLWSRYDDSKIVSHDSSWFLVISWCLSVVSDCEWLFHTQSDLHTPGLPLFLIQQVSALAPAQRPWQSPGKQWKSHKATYWHLNDLPQGLHLDLKLLKNTFLSRTQTLHEARSKAILGPPSMKLKVIVFLWRVLSWHTSPPPRMQRLAFCGVCRLWDP